MVALIDVNLVLLALILTQHLLERIVRFVLGVDL